MQNVSSTKEDMAFLPKEMYGCGVPVTACQTKKPNGGARNVVG